MKKDAIYGSLLGSAVGDALGLPMEGVSRRRQARIFSDLNRYQLVFGYGMVSDDAEHAFMTARCLAESGGDPVRFQRRLAWRLRFWLLAAPAGVGLATLRSIGKLLVGFSPTKSGVFSAGNGPAMRAPVIGAAYGHDLQMMKAMVRAATRITHTDPKAEQGAFAAALAAYFASQGKSDSFEYLDALGELIGAGELLELITAAGESAAKGESTSSFADTLGLERGVTGYMLHTMPVVIHAWLSHPQDIFSALEAVIRCGGDTDTTASILGGVIGAGLSEKSFAGWMTDRLLLAPLSLDMFRRTAVALAAAIEESEPQKTPGPFFPLVLIRNFGFMAIVLAHGLRRLAPPY